MFEFTTSNGATVQVYWVDSLLSILAIVVIVYIVQIQRLKKADKQFMGGIESEELYKKFIGLRRYFAKTKSVALHDRLSSYIAAIAIGISDTEGYFKNINVISDVSEENERRLYLLFVAFFTRAKYMDLHNSYRAQTSSVSVDKNAMLVVFKEYGLSAVSVNDRIVEIRGLITNQNVKAVFEDFCELLKEQTADGSVC